MSVGTPCVLDCVCSGERGRVARGHRRRGCIVPALPPLHGGESTALGERRVSIPDLRGVSVLSARVASTFVEAGAACELSVGIGPVLLVQHAGAALGAGCRRQSSTDDSG